jgi:predicted DNA binding CopG/RHH family protein
MTRLPKEIKNSLREEAKEWDASIAKEKVEDVQKLLNEAELFEAQRPARQPVSVRLDPYDISMIKRLARKKGIPYTQLMALWLHEKIEQEKRFSATD